MDSGPIVADMSGISPNSVRKESNEESTNLLSFKEHTTAKSRYVSYKYNTIKSYE